MSIETCDTEVFETLLIDYCNLCDFVATFRKSIITV